MSTPTSSLTLQAYATLRNAILRGELRPGEKIKIDAIRERTGHGASPVREALSLLTSDGLVERLDQRGFRTAIVSADDFGELLRTRCWLEERALRQAMHCGDRTWEEAIVLAEYHLGKTPRSANTTAFVANEAWEAAHRGFHRALISACDSRYLLRFCDLLYDKNIRYRNIAGASAYPSRQIEDEHKAIMEATLGRDTDRAVELLIGHYERTGGYLLDRLKAMA